MNVYFLAFPKRADSLPKISAIDNGENRNFPFMPRPEVNARLSHKFCLETSRLHTVRGKRGTLAAELVADGQRKAAFARGTWRRTSTAYATRAEVRIFDSPL